MKIFTLATRHSTGGAQLNAYLVARQLGLRGHSTKAVYFFDAGDMFVIDESYVCKLGGRFSVLMFFKSILGFFRLVRDERPDIIIGFHPFSNIMASIVGLFCGVKVIGTQRNPSNSMRFYTKGIEKFFGCFKYSKNICVSEAVRGSFSSYPKRYQDKLVVVHNGIDMDLSGEGGSEEKSVKKMVVGFIGRLDEQKDPELFVSSCLNFFKVNPGADVTVEIAGTGSLEARLREMVLGSDYDANFRFLGNLRGEHVPAFYKNIDVFVLTSRFEGFGRTIVENMYFGNPMILKDMSVCREVASSCASYCTSSDEYSVALSDLYGRWLEEGELKSQAILERSKRFSTEAMINGYERIVNESCNEH